jgi:hypothetical protein
MSTQGLGKEHSEDLTLDFEGDASTGLARVSNCWKEVVKKLREDSSSTMHELLDFKDDPENGAVILQKSQIEKDESQQLLRESIEFLELWYMLARKKLATKGTVAMSVHEEHFLSASSGQKPFPRKYAFLNPTGPSLHR